MIRYAITAIKRDGLRHLAFDNNERCNYESKERAEEQLRAITNYNLPELVEDLVGKDLQVTPVECYDGGDAMRTIFGSDTERWCKRCNTMTGPDHHGGCGEDSFEDCAWHVKNKSS